MKICPQCGTPLERRHKKDKVIWICPVCGYSMEDKNTGKMNPKGIIFKPAEKKGGDIIEERQRFRALSEITSCPKCGHSPVYYTSLQTRAADEPPVRIYKCPKCGYSWREYS
ncbi:MAG: transcription factor S [Candidatus Njordarchaeota archaeon]